MNVSASGDHVVGLVTNVHGNNIQHIKHLRMGKPVKEGSSCSQSVKNWLLISNKLPNAALFYKIGHNVQI